MPRASAMRERGLAMGVVDAAKGPRDTLFGSGGKIMRGVLLACAVAITVGGCAGTSTMPLAQDTVQITARAAPICGAVGAEKLALKQAAVETIRRGYDRFVVLNAQAGGTYRGNTAVVVQNMGGGTFVASGGRP